MPPVDDSAFLAAIDGMRARIAPAMLGAGREIGLGIVAKSMSAAPVERGTLRRSIHMEGPAVEGDAVFLKVFPSTVYARRIELGFMNMRDSLGRLFHQEPKPYFSPAETSVLQSAPGIIERGVFAAIGG